MLGSVEMVTFSSRLNLTVISSGWRWSTSPRMAMVEPSSTISLTDNTGAGCAWVMLCASNSVHSYPSPRDTLLTSISPSEQVNFSIWIRFGSVAFSELSITKLLPPSIITIINQTISLFISFYTPHYCLCLCHPSFSSEFFFSPMRCLLPSISPIYLILPSLILTVLSQCFAIEGLCVTMIIVVSKSFLILSNS